MSFYLLGGQYNDETWAWSDGSPLEYTDWGVGNPNATVTITHYMGYIQALRQQMQAMQQQQQQQQRGGGGGGGGGGRGGGRGKRSPGPYGGGKYDNINYFVYISAKTSPRRRNLQN